jgi:hypothetical protein
MSRTVEFGKKTQRILGVNNMVHKILWFKMYGDFGVAY